MKKLMNKNVNLKEELELRKKLGMKKPDEELFYLGALPQAVAERPFGAFTRMQESLSASAKN